MLIELIPLLMFVVVCVFLMLGYPVAFTLGGAALAFAGMGIVGGVFDPNLLKSFPSRLYGIMNNYTLVAVPLLLRKKLFGDVCCEAFNCVLIKRVSSFVFVSGAGRVPSLFQLDTTDITRTLKAGNFFSF